MGKNSPYVFYIYGNLVILITYECSGVMYRDASTMHETYEMHVHYTAIVVQYIYYNNSYNSRFPAVMCIIILFIIKF